jgi:hypothetical protein
VLFPHERAEESPKTNDEVATGRWPAFLNDRRKGIPCKYGFLKARRQNTIVDVPFRERVDKGMRGPQGVVSKDYLSEDIEKRLQVI